MRRNEWAGIVGQWLSLVLCAVGLVVEVVYKAAIGHLLITTAAVILAVSTKVKYYRGK